MRRRVVARLDFDEDLAQAFGAACRQWCEPNTTATFAVATALLVLDLPSLLGIALSSPGLTSSERYTWNPAEQGNVVSSTTPCT